MSAPGTTISALQDAMQDKLRCFERDVRALIKAALGQSPDAAIGAEVADENGRQHLLVLKASDQARGFGLRAAVVKANLISDDGEIRPLQGGIESMDAKLLIRLASNPITGVDLQRASDRYARNGSEAKLGQQIYSQLCAEIASLMQEGDYGGAIKAAESVDRDAQVRGESLGRLITQSVADGQAYYLITGVKDSQVRLQHLPILDGYSVSQWGTDAWVDRTYVDKQLRFSEAMSQAFGRRRGP